MKSLLLASFVALSATDSLAQIPAAQIPACQITVNDLWVRATEPQQKATEAFMQITAPQGARLVGASTPSAGAVEIHEMVLQNNVMKMRPTTSLELPAGQSVELNPGGYHLMLSDLTRPIKEGDMVPIMLYFELKDRHRKPVEVLVPARAIPAASTAGQHSH